MPLMLFLLGDAQATGNNSIQLSKLRLNLWYKGLKMANIMGKNTDQRKIFGKQLKWRPFPEELVRALAKEKKSR